MPWFASLQVEAKKKLQRKLEHERKILRLAKYVYNAYAVGSTCDGFLSVP